MTKTQKFLSIKSDIDELIENLDVDDMDVISAAKNQASLYIKASRYRVQKMRARIKAQSELEILEAEKALAIRKKDKDNKTKRTEGNIKQLLLRNPEILAANEKLNRALEEEEIAKRLLDAMDHRGKAIRIVADLIGYDVALEKKMGDFKEMVELRKKVNAKYMGS